MPKNARKAPNDTPVARLRNWRRVSPYSAALTSVTTRTGAGAAGSGSAAGSASSAVSVDSVRDAAPRI